MDFSMFAPTPRWYSIALMNWRLLNHTADIRIEGRGETREKALGALVAGLLHEVGGAGAPGAGTRRIACEGVDLADTVVGLLGEALWLVNGERWLPSSCTVESLSDTRAEAACAGAPIGDASGMTEIKAATFHDFEFFEDSGEWVVRVVFDV